jgi:hypothetical protein
MKFLLPLLLFTLTQLSAQVASPPPLLGLGDSIGEGVQSADASWQTQVNTYLRLIAQQMRVSFPLPLILASPVSQIFSIQGRARLSPNLPAADLAVSGAKVGGVLNTVPPYPVSDETGLVLEPYTASQLQIAESLRPAVTICWAGSDDALDAILNWNALNGTPPLTPVDTFASEYSQLVSGLTSWPGKVVVGTIPDVSQIGFVFSPQDLVTFLGDDYGLPQGSFTTLPTMLLIKLGLVSPSILQEPQYVMTPALAAEISDRVAAFNQIIKTDAAQAGIALADIEADFQQLQKTPPMIHGVPLLLRYNGGIFSLDGVHPSDTGHALAADVFIQALNSMYDLNIPLLSDSQIIAIADADPFIDWNGNLRVRGRPFAGLLETLGPILGISGDLNDFPGTSAGAAPASKINPAAGYAFMQQYFTRHGRPADTAGTQQDAINAMKEAFPLP